MSMTPEDNRILAMVFEHIAMMEHSSNCHNRGIVCRDYAKRFQPEPEPRYHVRHAEVWEDNDFLFSCESKEEAQRAVSALHDAAKGGKPE